jgi:hypothetical protein
VGYRRRHNLTDEDKEFHSWLKEHRDLVEETGLPEIILQDADHWFDFVDHGFLDHHDDPSRFTLDDLSERQKAALLALLASRPKIVTSQLGLCVIYDVIEAVRQRYKD